MTDPRPPLFHDGPVDELFPVEAGMLLDRETAGRGAVANILRPQDGNLWPTTIIDAMPRGMRETRGPRLPGNIEGAAKRPMVVRQEGGGAGLVNTRENRHLAPVLGDRAAWKDTLGCDWLLHRYRPVADARETVAISGAGVESGPYRQGQPARAGHGGGG